MRLPVLIAAAIVVAIGLWLLFRFVFEPLDQQPGASSVVIDAVAPLRPLTV